MKRLNIILLVLLQSFAAIAQNTIGLPDVLNYNKNAYNGGTQNWDIKQDKNGIVYFANNEGLLIFDGNYWSLLPIPNKTIVRSVEIDQNGRIYVGGQDEMGFFERNNAGELIYQSLATLLNQQDKVFGDVWDICAQKNVVYFRTDTKIFKISEKSATVYQAKSEWCFMGIVGNTVYAQDKKNGLMKLIDNNWTLSPFEIPALQSNLITSIFPTNSGKTICTTLKNGVFQIVNNKVTEIQSPTLNLAKSQRIYAACPTENGNFVLATTTGGIFIVDGNGNLIQHFSKEEGVQNNSVLSVLFDQQKNIWLGLENGIDCITYNSAIKHILPSDANASGYCTIIHNKQLFIGTSAGLYSTPLSNLTDLSFSIGSFRPVSNTTGQTWSLNEINGDLLLAHHEGAFKVENNNAIPISNEFGFWNFNPLSNVYPVDKIVAGNYKGVSILEYDGGRYSMNSNIPSFNETSRYTVIDKSDRIWVSHPYHGVYMIKTNADLSRKITLFNKKNGLPADLNNHVFKLKNKLVVATENGVFQYNEQKNKFEQDDFYKKILGDLSIRYLKEDQDGNIWFVHEKELGVIDFSFKQPNIIYFKELDKKILSGFELIYPIDTKNILIAGENGFFHVNFEKYKKNAVNLPVYIRQVKALNQTDKILFGGIYSASNNNTNDGIMEIAHPWKNIHFEFTSPVFGNKSTIQYSYRLKGLDNEWSTWSNKTEKDYTNLPPGKYYFEVKAKNCLNQESTVVSYGFKILPPWYKTCWAYILYALILLFSLSTYYYKQKRKFKEQAKKHKEEQIKLQYLHQLEIDKAESDIINLKNEKLQNEIDFKNSELATNAMHLVQKGEIIAKLKSELSQIMKGVENEKTLTDLKKMIKVIGEDDKMDKEWEHFAQHFDKVHSDFVVVLKETYPNISANEVKLCTYLRMNLSTKEIAQLMNISVRGVEISRYRLRKKIGLSTEVNLFDHLINMGNKK
jgi:DNA-binding CsgD family transcriptional regulator